LARGDALPGDVGPRSLRLEAPAGLAGDVALAEAEGGGGWDLVQQGLAGLVVERAVALPWGFSATFLALRSVGSI